MHHPLFSRQFRRAGYAFALLVSALCTQCTHELPSREPKVTKDPSSLRIKGVSGEVFTMVEEVPEFPGGIPGLMNYLGESIKYPAAAQKDGVGGRVFVRFIVDQDGKISNTEVLKGVRPDLDAEALRVVSQMPNWKPGRQGGKVVAVQYNLPIQFSLNAPSDEKQASNAKPSLYIVDGQVQAADFQPNSLNPDNLVAVDVLKGASAIATYGEQARDGVVVITTKGGTSQTETPGMDQAAYFLNDKPSTKAELDKLPANSLKSVNVIKNKTGTPEVRAYTK